MMKKLRFLFGFVLMLLLCWNNVQGQANIALTATATAYGNQAPWNWQNINNNNLSTCGTQTAFVWTASPPSSTAYMLWEWPIVYGMNKVIIHHANQGGRFLNGGMIQKWNGSAYVNHYQFSNLTQPAVNCNSIINFPVMASSKLRITSFTMGTGQSSNPNFREIQIYSVPLTGFDISLGSIDSPIVIGVGNNNVDVTIRNAKADTIYWFDVGYQLDNNTPVIINNLTPPSPLGPGESMPYSFATPIYIPTTGSYTLKAWANNANDSMPDNDPSNDTLIKTLCTGLQGTYTIGSTGDYANFNEAVTALKTCGIANAVRFEVQSGTYNERVIIPEILGASATNTITFDGINKANVTLTHQGTGNTNRATLILSGADYIKFTNMKIANTGTTYCVAIMFSGQAEYNVISDCKVQVNSTYTGYWTTAINSTSTESSRGYGNNANFIRIENCEIIGGYYGIDFLGTNTTTTCVGNQFIGNTFTGQHYASIYMYYLGRNLIEGNHITMDRYITSYGIFCYYGHGNTFNANIIKAGMYGIYWYFENYYGGSGDSSAMTNNMIYDFRHPQNQVGVYMYYGYRVNMLHNTIWVNGTSTSNLYAALSVYYYPRGSVIKNNIFMSTNKTYLVRYYYPDQLTMDYNVFFHPNSTTYMFYCYFPGASFYDLAGFRSWTDWGGTHDANSTEKDPMFASSTDLHLDSGFPPLRGQKTWVPFDVDGDPRCPYLSTIGADESTYPVPPPVAGFAVGITTSDTICFGTPYTFFNIAGANDPSGHWWYYNDSFMTNDLNFTHLFDVPDVDTITLVTKNCGGIDSISKVYVIDAPTNAPICDFIASENQVETYWPIEFYDLTQNCPSSWKWSVSPDSVYDPSFGWKVPTITFLPADPSDPWAPPTTDTTQNPIISFDYPGNYKVCFTASNLKGNCTICKDKYIVVKASQIMCQYVFPSVEKSMFGFYYDDGGPLANYANNSNNPPCMFKIDPCASEVSMTFSSFKVQGGDYLKIFEGTDNTGTPLWDLTEYGTNGLTGDMTNPAFATTYTSNTGKMYLEWTSNSTGQDSGWVAEWSGKPGNFNKPVAAFEGPDTICVNTMVYFTDKSSGDNLEYSWDFDNDGFYDYFGPNGEYIFFFPGVYTVVLNVHNCGGDSTITMLLAVVSPAAAPDAEFEADIRRPVAGTDVVTFSDVSLPSQYNTFGCSDFWYWEITPATYAYVTGDQFSSNPQIRFDDTGCYDVKFTAGYNFFTDTDSALCYIYAIQYCIPEVDNLNPDIGISRVILADIDNTSPIGSNAYTDFTATASTYLDLQAEYVLTVERNSIFNKMNRKVWIDYNIDGDFDDVGELVAQETEALTMSWTDKITIPATAVKGATRMRIGTSLGSMSNTACGTNLYGEYEDYRVIIREDGTPPVVELIGPDTVTLEQCDRSYIDSGATAEDNLDGTLTNWLQDTTDYSSSVGAGTYYYTWYVADGKGNMGSATRTIIVTPDTIVPELALLGNLVDTIDVFTSYSDPFYTANDTCSGLKIVTIDGVVDTSTVGMYELIYKASDFLDNFSQVSRIIYVLDRVDPQITLLGMDTIYLEVHDTFNDDWVTVSDNYDALDAQTDVVVTGNVDNTKLGKYVLTYSITDFSGNGPVSVSRTIKVIDVKAPSVVSASYNGESIGDGDTITIEVYDVFTMPEMDIIDNYYTTFDIVETGSYQQNFPNHEATSLGEYNVLYTITDSSSNATIIEFIIRVIDSQKPVITLVGNQFNNICRWDVFKNDSVVVTDNYDNNLTVIRGGSYINDYLVHMKLGMYNITYNVTDNSSNVSEEVIRYINVEFCDGYSITEGNLSDNVSIYPNPNNGQFTVAIELQRVHNINITVHNTLGEIVKTVDDKNSIGGTYEINMEEGRSGVYFVRVQTDEESVVHRVTVTK